MPMNYRIAHHLLRTLPPWDDLAGRCRLDGFRPFEVAADPDAQPDMLLRLDSLLTLEAFDYSEADCFDFEEKEADCHFGRHPAGYLFYMEERSTGRRTLFVTQDGERLVRSDIAAAGAPDPALLRFGLWMTFGLLLAPHHTVAIHSSCIVHDGRAVLFLGESGTGKSTHTRLWREHIPGARLLNDDSPILRIDPTGRPLVYGSPWSGKTPCYKAEAHPVAAVVRLRQGPCNRMRRLSVIEAIGALLPSCPPAFAYCPELQDHICATLSELIAQVPVYELECLPDGDAARLAFRTTLGQ